MMKSRLFTPSAVIPLVIFSLLAILIWHLVSQATSFSNRVTDYFAPTIHTVKSFAEAVNAVEKSSRKGIKPNPDAIQRFEVESENLFTLTRNWEPSFRLHIDEILVDARSILKEMQKTKEVLPEGYASSVTQFKIISDKLVKMHDDELVTARESINQHAFFIKLIAFFLLLAGLVFTFRELQHHRMKMKEQEKLSAIKAFTSALEARDPYTEGHSIRVAEYSAVIGREMGLREQNLENIEIAALMHDIGKIAVPDEVLLKKGKLTESEWELMKKHPVESARILQGFPSLKNIAPVTLQHHERYDGKGYPAGKAGKEIPLDAQILSLADAFDAMTSTRAYRDAMPQEKAVSEIRTNVSKQWSPEVVDAFLRSLTKKDIVLETVTGINE